MSFRKIFLNKCLDIAYLPILKLVLRPLLLNKSSGRAVLNYVCDIAQKHTDNYFNFKTIPKFASSYLPSEIKCASSFEDFAIVIQGLLEKKDDFTYQTVLLYKAMYPGIKIIVSTWDYEDSDQIKRYRELGCEVILSKDIEVCGMGNVNYQICTTLAGIKRAKELNTRYVLKNRSDLRLCREKAILYLKNLLDIYPVTDATYGQKGRIITQAANPGQMFIPYWLQDFIYFGYTDDLLELFDIPYSNEQIHSTPEYLNKNFQVVTGETLKNEGTPELYIVKSYLKKKGCVDDTVKHFWQLIQSIFLVVDQEAIGSFWVKYNIRDLSQYYCEYNGKNNFEDAWRHISHEDFVNIYTGEYIYETWMEKKCREYKIK